MKKIFNFLGSVVNRLIYENKDTFFKNSLYYIASGFIYLSKKIPQIGDFLSFLYKKYFDYPKILYIHPGVSCNFKCIYCYDRKIRNNKNILDFDDYKKIITDSKKLGICHVHILGGEPFLYNRIFDLIDYCYNLDLNINLYTNGYFLDSENIIKLKRFSKRLVISVSIHPEKVFKKLSGKDEYNKVSENILKARKAGLFTALLITVSKINLKYLPELIETFIIKNRLTSVFEKYLPIGVSEVDKKLLLNSIEWEEALKIQKKLFKRLKNLPIGKITPIFRGYGCNDYYEALHVSNTGELSPCEYVLDKISVGNIKDFSLEDLWIKYKENRKEWIYVDKSCRICSNKSLCGGGCPTYKYLMAGTFRCKDPLCNGKDIPFA